MIAFETNDLIQQRADAGKLYLEFLRVPSMSMGLYTLEVGAADPQQPHNEDEVYYIVSGRGQIYVAGENQSVQAGSIVFVAAHDEHYFHSIEEILDILVFFAPAET
ncbi:MAG: cupin domain-containing protein [Anaerolineales bacterium]|nr:cupin domain-containing protein [Anaerolineales bacterium]